MQRFRVALDACGFMDLGYMGSPFMWQKHFKDGHSVWERLDRALANAVNVPGLFGRFMVTRTPSFSTVEPLNATERIKLKE